MEKYINVKDIVLEEIDTALSKVNEKDVEELVGLIHQAEKVFAIGVGRVFLVIKALVKRLNHIGINANYVGAINEPPITDKDILIIGSGSGESIVPVAIAKKAKKYGAKIIHIGSNANSSIQKITDLFIRIPCQTKLGLKDEIKSKQPMSSLFEQSLMLFGDIIVYMIIKNKKIDLSKLWNKHANLE